MTAPAGARPPLVRVAGPRRRPALPLIPAGATVLVALTAAQGTLTHRVRPTPLMQTVAVGWAPSALAVDPRRHHVFVANSLGDTVSVLDPRRGGVLRTVAVGFEPDAVAVDPRSARVFVVKGHFDGTGSVSVLDASSGGVLATVAVGLGPGAVGVDASAGRVVVATDADTRVSLLDARRGRLLQTVALPQGASSAGAGPGLDPGPGSLAVAVDARTGQAVVADSATDTVRVLDVRHGVVLRALPAGVQPLAVAVDEGAGRAVVVNYGGPVPTPVPWWVPAVQRLRPWLPGLALPAPASRPDPGSVSVLDAARV